MAARDEQNKPPLLIKNQADVLDRLGVLIKEGEDLWTTARGIGLIVKYETTLTNFKIWSETTTVYLNTVFNSREYGDRFEQAISTYQTSEEQDMGIAKNNLMDNLSKGIVIMKTAKSVAGMLDTHYGDLEPDRMMVRDSSNLDDVDAATAENLDMLDDRKIDTPERRGITLFELIHLNRNPIFILVVALLIIVLLLVVFGAIEIDLGSFHLGKPTNPSP